MTVAAQTIPPTTTETTPLITLEEAIERTEAAVNTYHHDMAKTRIADFWYAIADYRNGERPNSMFYLLTDIEKNWEKEGILWKHKGGTEARFRTTPTTEHEIRDYNGRTLRTLAQSKDHDGFHPVNGVLMSLGAKLRPGRSWNAYQWDNLNNAIRAGIASNGLGHDQAYTATYDTGCVSICDGGQPHPVLVLPTNNMPELYAVDTTTDKNPAQIRLL